MNAVQAIGDNPAANSASPNANGQQLMRRHDAVLVCGNPCQLAITVGAFVPHTGIKAPSSVDSPLERCGIPYLAGKGATSEATNSTGDRPRRMPSAPFSVREPR